MLKLNLNKILIISGITALVFVAIFLIWWQKAPITINNENKTTQTVEIGPKSPITGTNCDNAAQRPLAVMISSDPVTRPLSGISQADIVFEMPVTPSGVTRMMSIYQCEEPKDIGSIRSARQDFIPLAAGLDAIYAHWGGEHGALQNLNNHVIDNIDAMKYETVYFYRKAGVPQPHNGFSDYQRLVNGAKDLNYSLSKNFSGYPHLEKNQNARNILNLVNSISIDYTSPFNVLWSYDENSDTYKRLRNGQPETDRNNGNQVSVSTVIVMKTTSSFTSKDYLTVVTAGNGDAVIYQNGVKIEGKWSKDPATLDSKLFFYDNDGKEIELAPGKIWVEIETN